MFTQSTYSRLETAARGLLFALLVLLLQTSAYGAQSASLFEAPAPPQYRYRSKSSSQVDEIYLISTRKVGTACNAQKLQEQLHCEKLILDHTSKPSWEKHDWRELFQQNDRQTIVYIHGNRVERIQDRAEGLAVYLSMKRHGKPRAPVRYIIWSWPSSQIPGLIKDYKVKAAMTHPVAWQFAWFLNQMPSDSKISMIGYSYGTRVISGAVHLLHGGSLGKLKLASPANNSTKHFRAALLAAAYDSDWIQPGNYYGLTIKYLENLVLGTNKQDPAMKYYHLSNGRGHIDALGKVGIESYRPFGRYAKKIKQVDFTANVGRSHAITDYLSVSGKMSSLWNQLLSQNEKPKMVEKVATMLQGMSWLR